jgi:transcriptional regulator with XRE-family HTH domain
VNAAVIEERRGLAERLKAVRGARTRVQFAVDLGVFQQNISRYEKGVAPHVDTLILLRREEGVDLNWLLTGEPGA